MEININQKDLKQKPERPKKKRLGCLIPTVILAALIVILIAIFHSYILAFYEVLRTTGNVIPTEKNDNNINYQYNGKQGLINILLLGSDNDSKFDPENVLTQTMIIVSINTDTKEVNMISIPRDSWVPITGMKGGYGKIDQASGIGGLALARSTVEKDYGVHIDYYGWVGLKGFVKGIDTLGGINIDVTHPVLDEEYPNDITGDNPYSAIRLYLPPGAQHLNGTTALEYVRSRHGDAEGDFGRSARQQQVLLKVKDKVATPGIIPEIPNLVDDMKDSVRTDISLTDLIHFAPLLLEIKNENIHRYILNPPDYGKNTMSADGQAIVAPDFNKIGILFDKIFNN